MTAAERPPRAGFNPFPGLRPFREEEEYLFFGREQQCDALVNKLAETRFLAVVGTSGSGKSSLVNCGLRPALHRGLMARAGSAWRVTCMRPGYAPLRELAESIAAPGVLFPLAEAEEFSQAELVESTLRSSKLGLIDVFEQARLPARTNVLIVVDQFEELFRYRALAAGGGVDEARVRADATAFMNLLLEVPAHPDLPIYIVLTMRSDFLGDCAQFYGLPEAINRGQYLVPRLTRDERRKAIAGPVGVGGAALDPLLLTRLVNDVGDNPDQLSQLQHAMHRTWVRWQDARSESAGSAQPIGLPHYEAIGTIAHALNQHAEEAFAQLPDEGSRLLCEELFKAITDRRSDAKGVRRPTRLDALCAITGASVAALIEVIEVFRDPRCAFLMPPAGEPIDGGTVVDISHESLMRVWTRLRQWGDDEAQSARILRRVAKTAELNAQGEANLLRDPELQVAKDWVHRQKPNPAWAARYHPQLGAGLNLIARSDRAVEAEREQESQRQAAEAALKLENVRLRQRIWRATAFMAVLAMAGGTYYLAGELDRQKKRLQARLTVSENTTEQARLVSLRNFKQAQDAQNRLDQALAAAPSLESRLVAASPNQPMVYLQTPEGPGQVRALALQARLRKADIRAPGIETVKSSPRNFELRYFRDDDEEVARSIAAKVGEWGFADLQVVRVKGYEAQSRPGQFEIWFPAPASDGAPAKATVAKADLASLVLELDAADAGVRKKAVALLVRNYGSSAEAVDRVVALYAGDAIGRLSSNGRINGLYFLASTNAAAWTPRSIDSAREALRAVDQSGAGPETRAALKRLERVLDSASK